MIRDAGRLYTIQRVMLKYGLDELILSHPRTRGWRRLLWLAPSHWQARRHHDLPRGARLRLALEELGPVFVKLGQMLSTRRDLLPDDIGDELAKLQDEVPPFSGSAARERIETSLGQSVDSLFARFEEQPMASASIAQVHAVELHDGSQAVVKVLRPGIRAVIDRDIGLMFTLARLAERYLPDGRRLHPFDVVNEYERTIRGELDLRTEASNAVVLKQNFKDSDKLHVPAIHWDFTREEVMVQERIHGISIREVETMRALGMDMHKLAEHGVEIFYTQVFQHNFFHADMHPGNIFVSPDRLDYPQYIAVDFGIVGSLTDEDQRYIGENLLAFFERDYRRVAQLHIDSGWVPPGTRVSELEASIRAVTEPILDKPLADISFGDVLFQLFHVARRFEMEVQPQLILLQKTLMNIEGLGRDLYPELDLWATGKPHLQKWMKQRNDPRRLLRRLIENGPEIIDALPEIPLLVHRYMEQTVIESGRNGPARRNPEVAARKRNLSLAETHRTARRLRLTMGSGLALVAVALVAGSLILRGDSAMPWWIWFSGALCLILLWRSIYRD